MCMLCVVQKWSRCLLALIGMLWALSHFLAPSLRFEFTSPRLACVSVLLLTVFWYEVLLPRVSAYWARRTARIREQQRIKALELQKLRKSATRRCRNCLATYREQSPGGGKFTCSYCGHVSKRPVLDLPGPSGRTGYISTLIGSNSWFCSHDCSTDGSENCGDSFPLCWALDGEEQFLTEKSYSRFVFFIRNMLLFSYCYVKRLCGKVLSLASYAEVDFSDTDKKGLLSKGENRANSGQEDKVERARRKAEEKRQARLEKEMLEAEERRQREEVAKLIEEMRKFRDANPGAEKEGFKGRSSDEESVDRKRSESEKICQKERKEKDRSSSRSSSDGEGNEKREIREREKKDEHVRKSEAKRRNASNTRNESQKVNMDTANSVKDVSNGDRSVKQHLDHLARKVSHNSNAPIPKSGKPAGGVADPMKRRECHVADHVNGSSLSRGDPRITGTACSRQTRTGTLERSWHQLFTSPSAGSQLTQANDTGIWDQIVQPEVQISKLLEQKLSGHPSHKQIHTEQSSSITFHPVISNYSTCGSDSAVSELRSFAEDSDNTFTREDMIKFEDPCYVPEPIAEPLNNFNDVSSGSTGDFEFHIRKKAFDSADAKKPSPIEAPVSKLRVFKDGHVAADSCIPNSQVGSRSPHDGYKDPKLGTWQMWSSPLCQDLLSMVAAPATCLSAPGQNSGCSQEESIWPSASMSSHAVKNNDIARSVFSHSPIAHVGHGQDDGLMSSATTTPVKGGRYQNPSAEVGCVRGGHLFALTHNTNMPPDARFVDGTQEPG